MAANRGTKDQKEQAMNQVKEGAQLSMALKSEAGTIIVNHLVDALGRNILTILNGQRTLTPDQILNKVSECHGIVSAMDGMGDKVRYVAGFIARKNAEQALGA